MDVPATPGDWVYRMAGRESLAEFRGQGAAPLFSIACASPGQVRLAATGQASTNAMTIRTEELTRAINATPASGTVAATLPARDPLLAAMAFSKGRFAVESPGLATLYLPAWPEVTRVVEDCL
jgi:hypothetical protein